MPTYDYRCQACGHEFEEFQSMLDDPLTQCPACKGLVKRLIGKGIGIQFKGGGFYVTDSSQPKSEPKSSDKPASSSGS